MKALQTLDPSRSSELCKFFCKLVRAACYPVPLRWLISGGEEEGREGHDSFMGHQMFLAQLIDILGKHPGEEGGVC